jgi:hypothetical protein
MCLLIIYHLYSLFFIKVTSVVGIWRCVLFLEGSKRESRIKSSVRPSPIVLVRLFPYFIKLVLFHFVTVVEGISSTVWFTRKSWAKTLSRAVTRAAPWPFPHFSMHYVLLQAFKSPSYRIIVIPSFEKTPYFPIFQREKSLHIRNL